ncbi:MAG TPA: branched-chain amino acid ABC transporter substrate-binding protein [Chloroflexota bacterium]|nr:branched-chain amino acid ABC transporter substrate-binding protein [Chloroflexota bacterium]
MKLHPGKRMFVGLAGLLALALAGAPGAGAHQAQAGTITLGFYAPLSGAYASAGQDMLNAMKLAVAAANKSGGVMGEKIAIDAQDSPCNPQVAVQAAQKLVSDGVAAVIGPYCSGDALPASVIFHRTGLPMITSAATNPKLTDQGFSDMFRTIGRDDEQGLFAANFMNKMHYKTVALVHDNTVYAKGVATQTQAALKAHFPGIKVVYFDAITPGSRDFSSILTNIRSLKPSVTYFTGYFSDGGLLLKQFEQLGVPGQFMAADANNDPTFIKLAGKYAEKALITTAPIPQLVSSSAGFVKQYTATYHQGPGAYSAYTYDATNLALHAITVAKSTSASAINKVLLQTKNFMGITGPITFNSKGDRVQLQYIVVTVRNGQFVAAKM